MSELVLHESCKLFTNPLTDWIKRLLPQASGSSLFLSVKLKKAKTFRNI